MAEAMSISLYRVHQKAILLLDDGEMSQQQIAWDLAVSRPTVMRHLCRREPEITSKQPARVNPRAVPLTMEQECAVIAFYCQSTPPPGLQRWTLRTAAQAINANPDILGRTVHASTIVRVLSRHHLRPHKKSYFLHIRDEFFVEKMRPVLAVYRLPSNYIFCFDERLNQVETWFGLLRRYTLDDGWFDSVDALICSIMAFVQTWNDQLAHPFTFRHTGEGIEGLILRRFTRILAQPREQLAQLDSKFPADLSLLTVRLIDHHREHVKTEDWQALQEIVTARREELQAIVSAETGPVRKRRAGEAFGLLCEHLAA